MNRKIGRKILYVVLGLFFLYLLLLLGLTIYVHTNKAEIISTIKADLRQNIQGNINIKDADVSIWRSFPKIEVALKDVSITDSVYHAPFLKMQEIDVSVGLIDILGKQTDISRVKLTNGLVHVFTDTSGYTNSYVVTAKKTLTNNTKSNANSLFVDEVIFENIHIVSENKRQQKRFDLQFAEMDADIEKKDSLLLITMKENCFVKGLGFDLSRGSFINNQTLEATWNIKINTNEPSISFDETNVSFNRHPFKLQGTFYLNTSSPHFNLSVKTDQISYQQATQLLPQNVQRTLKVINLSKPLNVAVTLNGSLAPETNPVVIAKWATEKNIITTPVVSFANCSFNGSYTNEKVKGQPVTDENSEIIFDNFLGDWGNINLAGRDITITNLTTPVIKFEFISKCNFKQLDETLGLNTIRFLSGDAKVYFRYNGLLLTDALQINKLTLSMQLQNGSVEYEPRALVFTNCNGEILLSQDFLQINNLNCNLKENHFLVNVAGSNISNLSSKDSGKASLICSVYTPSLNLADFSNLFADEVQTAKEKSNTKQSTFVVSNIDDVLEQGSLQLDLKADTMLFNKFNSQHAQAQLLFESNDWQIQQASVEHAGGKIILKAKVTQANASNHQANLSAQLQNVDIKKLFYAFNNFGQQGIEYQNLQGKVNSNATVNFNLDNKGKVISRTLQGTVDFSIKNGALINYEPIERVQQYVFQDRDFKHIEFAELKDKLDINKTEIHINRMEIESSVLTAFIEGNYSLQNNTDLSIQVPLKNFGLRPDDFKPTNKGSHSKPGASIYLRARPDKDGNIKVGLDLFGKFRNKN